MHLSRGSRAVMSALIFVVMVAVSPARAGSEPNPPPRGRFTKLFGEICAHLDREFFRPDRWRALIARERAAMEGKVARARTLEAFAELVNEFLGELKTSHTSFFPKGSKDFFHYVSVFGKLPQISRLFRNRPIRYPSIGVYPAVIDGRTHVLWVLDGSPAARAGIRQGDEIVRADGHPFHPIESLKKRIGQPVHLEIRRHRDGPIVPVEVVPALVDPHQEFLDAELASVRVFPRRGRRIGYIRIWSYAGEDYHQAFLDEIAGGRLQEADALILDLRDGLGGANPSYLNVFNRNVPVIRFAGRSGPGRTFDPQWRKPVVLLINGGSRSGKEVFAFGFQKYGLGKIIGERSAGAVTAGRIIPLSDGSLLYLAAAGGTVDGIDLEGVGVTPDLLVPMPIPYLAGRDVQLARALECLAGELR